MMEDRPFAKNNSNTHRSLKQLAIIDAWFLRDKEDKRRYTLHADVSFNEERLGGGDDAEIIFKVSVRRCEIAFIKPSDSFRTDRASVKRGKPRSPEQIKQSRVDSAAVTGKGRLSISRKPAASGTLEGEASHQRNRVAETSWTEGAYNERFVKTKGDHDGWRVDGDKIGGRLDGPVFDAHGEPRLTIVDIRDEDARIRDEQSGFEPSSTITITCIREDIDIYEIKYKDPERQSWFESQRNRKEKETIARQILREALFQEGLSAGDLVNDPYAEMVICDATIPIVDEGN